MKILMISSYLPYPLFSGGAVRLFNLIKLISKKHEITLVCEKRDNQTEDDVKEVLKYCKNVIAVKRLPQWSFSNILRTGFSSYPFLLIGHENKEMRENLISILKNQTFDLIHIETFYIYHNLPRTYLPIVLAEQNIEYLVYEKYKNNAPFYLKLFLNWDILKIKKWEKYFWRKANSLIAVSESDRQIMGDKAYLVANGVDLNEFPFKKEKNTKVKTILFMGDFKWIQNQQAIKWILDEILPEILKKNNKIKLWVVGKNMPDQIIRKNYKNVFFDENASSKTSDIYKKADLLLAPIKIGGGTSFKILEAMASGVPVVTTELGIKGIGAKDKVQVLVSETSLGLANASLNILEDTVLKDKIRKNARFLIEEKYSWLSISKSLEKIYENTIFNK